MSATWRQRWHDAAVVVGRPQARWLCEEASGAFDDEFLETLDDVVADRSSERLDAMLARVQAGEPLQYVLGHWSFRRLDLLVDRRVLIPRPETELVAEHAINLVRGRAAQRVDRPLKVADLGTGSGAIGLSLALELPHGLVDVWLTDVSADAVDVARANAAGLGMAGERVHFATGSWFEALPDDLRNSLALVVSNPPYVAADDADLDASVRRWEPPAAVVAADGGLADVRAICASAPQWLSAGGWLVLEIGATQGPAVCELLMSNGFVGVAVHRDLAGRDRIVVGQRHL